MTLPDNVANLFWNIDPSQLQLERDARLIISTVLPRGGTAAVQWLFQAYGTDRIRRFILDDTQSMGLLPDSERQLWRRILAPEAALPAPQKGIERWRPRRHLNRKVESL